MAAFALVVLLAARAAAQACDVASLASSFLHTQGHGYNVFADGESSMLCVDLAVYSGATRTPQEVLDEFFPGETCASIRQSEPDLNVCPAQRGLTDCDTPFFNTAWYYCLPPQACADGSKDKGWLVTLPADFCFLIGTAFLEVTFADGVAPLTGCQTADELGSTLSPFGILDDPTIQCTPLAQYPGEEVSTLAQVVADHVPGDLRCGSVVHAPQGSPDECPVMTDLGCHASFTGAEWWQCAPSPACPGYSGLDLTETTWIVATPAESSCTASLNTTLFQVTTQPQVAALRGLKRISRPFVSLYDSSGNLEGTVFPGLYPTFRDGSDDADTINPAIRHNGPTEVHVPEGLAILGMDWRWLNVFQSPDVFEPIVGPFTGSFGLDDLTGIIVSVQPGYYADVWRDDLEAVAAAYRDVVEVTDAPTEAALEPVISPAMSDVVAYADTYSSCTQLRKNVPPFATVGAVGNYIPRAPMTAFDLYYLQTELSDSPYDVGTTLLAQINKMSSAIVDIGYRARTFNGAPLTSTEYAPLDSGAFGTMGNNAGYNTINSVVLDESPWCQAPPQGGCGLVASADNMFVGTVERDPACVSPDVCQGSDFGGYLADLNCVPFLGVAAGITLADATTAGYGSPCTRLGDFAEPDRADTSLPPLPPSQHASACSDWTIEDGYAHYLCDPPRDGGSLTSPGNLRTWVRAPTGTCDVSLHAVLAWDASAPCVTGCDNLDLVADTASSRARTSKTFVHWGRTDCPASTATVYTGYAAGSVSGESGGSASAVCVSDDPSLDMGALWTTKPSSDLARAQDVAQLHRLEYGFSPARTSIPELLDLGTQEMPCAVCAIDQRTVWTQYGSDVCPEDEYDTVFAGYLATSWWQDSRGDYICMSQTPEGVGSAADEGGAGNAYLVEGRLSVAPGYIDNRELTCAVCASKERSVSSTFVNYGSTSCPDNSVDIVSGGRLASSHVILPGGGSRYLCLTPSPSYTNANTIASDAVGIFRVEFETAQHGVTEFVDLQSAEAGCSVCLASERAVSLTVPGTVSCPTGFSRDYRGWLMAQNAEETQTEYVCVNEGAAPVGSLLDEGGATLFPVETTEYAGAAYGYVNDAEVPCAQCSAPTSPVFTRWGRRTCPSTSTLLYEGIAMGSLEGGSGSNVLCMAEADYPSTPSSARDDSASLVNVEYAVDESTDIFVRAAHGHEMPCAVCAANVAPHRDGFRLPSDSFVAVGLSECPADHRREYSGRLFSRHPDASAKTDFFCVDARPETSRGSMPGFQAGLEAYEVEARNDLTPEIPDDAEIPCSVCSRLAPAVCQSADIAELYGYRTCKSLGTVTGPTLADAAQQGLGAACSVRGAVSTDPTQCPAETSADGAAPCADEPHDVAHDLYICEGPLSCSLHRDEAFLVRVAQDSCTFDSHMRVSFADGVVPAAGVLLPFCAATEFGGVFQDSSCRPLGRSEPGQVLSDFIAKVAPTWSCLTETLRTRGSALCPNRITGADPFCDQVSTANSYDWYECTAPTPDHCAATDFPDVGRLLVRTDPGTCTVRDVSQINVQAFGRAKSVCDGPDFGGVFTESSCEFAGQAVGTSADSALDLGAPCAYVGPVTDRVDQCPCNTFGDSRESCSAVSLDFPLDNYVCSYPTESCGVFGQEFERVWVRAEPGTCQVVEIREIAVPPSTTASWVSVVADDGNAAALRLTFTNNDDDIVLQETVTGPFSSGSVVQVPAIIQPADTAIDLAFQTLNVSVLAGDSSWTPVVVALADAPGYYPPSTASRVARDCQSTTVHRHLGDAVGMVLAGAALSSADGSALGDLDGCGSTSGLSDFRRVFSWTAPAAGTVTVTATPFTASFDPLVAVYDTLSCASLACTDDPPSLPATTAFEAAEGGLYYFVVASTSNTASGAFNMTLDLAPVSPEFVGDCAPALATTPYIVGPSVSLSGVLTVADSTVFPNLAGSCPSVSTHQKAWLWRAPANGDVTVSVSGSASLNPVVAILAASDSACTVDTCVVGDATSSVVADEYYYVVLMGDQGSSGLFAIDLAFAAARRHHRADRRRSEDVQEICFVTNPAATPVLPAGHLGYGVAQASTAGAPALTTLSCAAGSAAGQAAFVFDAPFDGVFQVSTEGSDFDTVVEVFGASDCAAVICNDDAVGTQSLVRFAAAAGERSIVVVGGRETSEGLVSLSITAPGSSMPAFTNAADASLAPGGAGQVLEPGSVDMLTIKLAIDVSSSAVPLDTDPLELSILFTDMSRHNITLVTPSALAPGASFLFTTVLPSDSGLSLQDAVALRIQAPDVAGVDTWILDSVAMSIDSEAGLLEPVEYEFLPFVAGSSFSPAGALFLVRSQGPPAQIDLYLSAPPPTLQGPAYLLFSVDDAHVLSGAIVPVEAIESSLQSLTVSFGSSSFSFSSLSVTLVALAPLATPLALDSAVIELPSGLQYAFSFSQNLTANLDGLVSSSHRVAFEGLPADSIDGVVLTAPTARTIATEVGSPVPDLRVFDVPANVYPLVRMSPTFGVDMVPSATYYGPLGATRSITRLGQSSDRRTIGIPAGFSAPSAEIVVGANGAASAAVTAARFVGDAGVVSSFTPVVGSLAAPGSRLATNLVVDSVPDPLRGIEVVYLGGDLVELASIEFRGVEYVPATPACPEFGSRGDILAQRMVFVPRPAGSIPITMNVTPAGDFLETALYVGLSAHGAGPAASTLVTSKGANPACADPDTGAVAHVVYADRSAAFPPVYMSLQSSGPAVIIDVSVVDSFGFEWTYRAAADPLFALTPAADTAAVTTLDTGRAFQVGAFENAPGETVLVGVVGATADSSLVVVLGLEFDPLTNPVDCSGIVGRVVANSNPSCAGIASAIESLDLVSYMVPTSDQHGGWSGNFNTTDVTHLDLMLEVIDVSSCTRTEATPVSQ